MAGRPDRAATTRALARAMAKAMRERRLSEYAAAKRSGLSCRSIHRYVTGECAPSVPSLIAFAYGVGCDASELVGMATLSMTELEDDCTDDCAGDAMF